MNLRVGVWIAKMGFAWYCLFESLKHGWWANVALWALVGAYWAAEGQRLPEKNRQDPADENADE